MLTIENLISFKEYALCPASSQYIREAYSRFRIYRGRLEVFIAKKYRPVFYKDGRRNIDLEFDTTNKKWAVTINYDSTSLSFFVGEAEANIVDCILVWLICPQDAHFSSYTPAICYKSTCHPPPRKMNYVV